MVYLGAMLQTNTLYMAICIYIYKIYILYIRIYFSIYQNNLYIPTETYQSLVAVVVLLEPYHY